MLRFLGTLLAGVALVSARSIPGDSRRGAALFESQGCISCHGQPGAGAAAGGAPDLGRWSGRSFTPLSLATYLWNHSPAMWKAMETSGRTPPALNEQQAADLFAFFYAHRYFESPGEAGRGKQVFASAQCGTCHALRGERTAGTPPPLVQWRNTSDPIAFTSSLWNHAPRMLASMKEKKIDWPDFTPQQLTDLLVYARRLPGARPAQPEMVLTDAREGEGVFKSKGCAGCHSGSKTLDQLRHRTLAGFAVAMWNHAPLMKTAAPELSPDELRQVVAYLWSISYFDEPGDAKAGARVYAAKRCDTCHASSTWMAPALAKRAQPLHAIDFLTTIWRHGPSMHAKMRDQKIAWPAFRGNELGDLIAFINAKRD